MQSHVAILKNFGTSLAFYFSQLVYRLFFHPLSRYPGAKLGIAFPRWYKLYRNFRQRGQYIFEIEKLHKQYGPVIRIGVNDLHINDPEVYLQITKVGSPYLKDPKFYDRISFKGSSLGYGDPAHHRARRQALMVAFAPKKIQELAPMIQDQVDKLLTRYESSSNSGIPVNIYTGCKALAMDIISKITMGEEFGCLDHPQFRNLFLEKLHAIFDEMGWLGKVVFSMTKVSLSSPNWMFRFVYPPSMIMLKEKCKPLIRDYLEEKFSSVSGVPSNKKSVILDVLVDPEATKDHQVLSMEQLSEEAVTLLTAGGDTISSALIFSIYHICRHPEVYQRLESELLAHFPTPTSQIEYEEVSRLPYLTATIKEILRTSNPLPGRLPRVVPPEGFQLYGQHIPGGTVINTSAYLLNRHPSVWSEPEKFSPERWLSPDSAKLDKYMTSFYRGTRQCIGKDLAWCELYLTLASLFRRYHVSIHNTTDADMEWVDAVLIVFKGKKLHATLKKRERQAHWIKILLKYIS